MAFERLVLGAGMTVMAFFIERRLIKAIKKGSVEPAARTAGGLLTIGLVADLVRRNR